MINPITCIIKIPNKPAKRFKELIKKNSKKYCKEGFNNILDQKIKGNLKEGK